MKIQKKNIFFFGGGVRSGGGVRLGGGGQGGWEQRIEAFVKIRGGGGGGGVRSGVGMGEVRGCKVWVSW